MRGRQTGAVVVALGLLVALAVGAELAPGAVWASQRMGARVAAHGAVLPASSSGPVMPPDTSQNIHLFQVFAEGIPYQQLPEEDGIIDVNWSSYYPTYPAGVFNMYYTPYDRDNNIHPLSWFVQYHPDWVVYTCASQTTPTPTPSTAASGETGAVVGGNPALTHTPAYEFGDTAVPLDITNPDVLSYLLGIYEQQITAGFQGISFDNVDFSNFAGRCGVWTYDPMTHNYDIPKYLYGGSTPDATIFKQTVLNWAQYIYGQIHPQVIVGMNWQLKASHSLSEYEQIVPYLDLVFDEEGFTNNGLGPLSGATWQNEYQAMSYLNTQGKAALYNCYEPTPWSQLKPDEIQWCLGNYLLAKGSHSYVMMSGSDGNGGYVTHYLCLKPDYFAAIGTPTGSAVQESSGVYVRYFSQGLVIVNPTTASQYVPVSLSGYKPIEPGIGDVSPMAPETAYVLIGSSVPYPQLPAGYTPPASCG